MGAKTAGAEENAAGMRKELGGTARNANVGGKPYSDGVGRRLAKKFANGKKEKKNRQQQRTRPGGYWKQSLGKGIETIVKREGRRPEKASLAKKSYKEAHPARDRIEQTKS